MPRLVVLGGTGAVGRALAARLLPAGWSVDLVARTPGRLPAELLDMGGRFVPADRAQPDGLDAAVGAGADLVVDNACYTADQARMLVARSQDIGAIVLVSSKAVYVDALGRHSNSPEPPDFGGPVRETAPTLAPREDLPYDSPAGYGPNKVAAEQALLERAGRVTVLRPSKIHGPGSVNPREWHWVVRALDSRPVDILDHLGRGTDHPTAAANIAALVEVVHKMPGARVLNVADADSPDGLAIARTVARHLGRERREVLLDGADPAGAHPWDSVPPRVLDLAAARALGWTPLTYAESVGAELDWLAASAAGRVRPDYAAEDALLARTGEG